MTWGEGSLFLATRKGVLVLGRAADPGLDAGADVVGTRLRVRVGSGVADSARSRVLGSARDVEPPGLGRAAALAGSQQ